MLFVVLLIRQRATDQRSKRLRKVITHPLFAKQVRLEQKLESNRFRSRSVLWKIGVVGALAVVWFLAKREIELQGNHLKGFDPYELLGVEFDAPVENIKKAYR